MPTAALAACGLQGFFADLSVAIESLQSPGRRFDLPRCLAAI